MGAAVVLVACSSESSVHSTTASQPAGREPGTAAKHAPTTAISGSRAGCRSGDPLANVYHPYRLQVRNACMTVTGTVAYIHNENDGDVHVDLALPASESGLLNKGNDAHQDGQLVTEIVPADQPGCTPGRPSRPAAGSDNYGICTGADLVTPPIGAQVTVVGPYVLDANHGWMEIHPVWTVTLTGHGSSTSPATSSPATSPPSSTPSSGAWCQATASPSSDGFSGDYDVSVHSNQPDQQATASDAGDTWHQDTNSSGYADIQLWHTSAGEPITVTVGSASCSTTA